jgi:eukaryotic-like serine/threonine-protein kinase
MNTPHPPGPDGETRPAAESAPERRLGPYKLVREIGHGGMGVVFLAARADDQYRKRVAIKIIPVGADSAEAIRHFRRERQILASLDHPNIARLLDGGTTDDSRPYLVMEYIEGEAITRYCNRHEHTLADRLGLFQRVCAAVAHAHRNLVVHRDLKPGNILVTADGTPKLLDFGIASFVNPELSGDTVDATRRALTPEYASPEQIQGGVVTTASDTYSLGVVLYELLTGRSPYRVRTSTAAELYRVVCEQEPDRPSTALAREESSGRRTDATASQVEVEKGPATAVRHSRALRGDLDTILLKALRKEPSQRYLSVEALSDDVRRYLEGRPVTARRPTMVYRVTKFVGRNWMATTAAAAAILLVLTAVVALAIQAQRLERERNKSEQIAAFLKDLFTAPDPTQARGNTVTAREILDAGAARIETTLAGETRADLLSTLGEVYASLGLYADAERLQRQALELHRTLLGDTDEVTQQDVAQLTFLLHQAGRSQEAVTLATPALAFDKEAFGEDHPVTRRTKRALGSAYVGLGRLEEAEPLFTELVETETRLLGADHEDTLKSLNNLAVLYHAQKRVDEALELDERVLSLRRRRLGDDHPLTIGSINNVVFRYTTLGRHDDARALLQEALALADKTFGTSHPSYGTVLHSLGEVELATGNFEAADQRLRATLAIYRLQPGHRYLGLVLYELGQVSAELSKPDEALDFLEQARRNDYWVGKPVNLRGDPHLSKLAADPRMKAFEEGAAATGGGRR